MSASQSGSASATSVLFVDCYPKSLYGAQLTLLDLATGLSEITPSALLVDDGPLATKLQATDVDTIVVPYPPTLRRYDGELLNLSAPARARAFGALCLYNLRVAKRLRRRRPDVIYCANLRAVLSVGLAAKLVRSPLVWHVQLFKGSAGILDRIAAMLSTRIVVISPRVDRAFDQPFVERFADKITSIPIGIDALYWSRQGPTPPNDVVRLVSVGSIGRLKGLDTLIRATHRVAATTPVVVDIVGAPKSKDDERYLTELRALVDQLGLADVVHWKGHVDDVRPYVASADLLVSASHREGVPRSIVEAMMLGTPAVATDVGGVSDLVVDGVTGYLVAPGEPAELANAILGAVENRAQLRQVGEQAARHVAEIWSRPRFLSAFEGVFRDLSR